MNKTTKNIILVFIIGCIVFVIGNFLSDGFDYKNGNEFLIDFGFYQLYSFLLGYSNMYFFEYMENIPWKKTDTIKRIILGILGSVIITLIGLFIMRVVTVTLYYDRSFKEFLANESIQNYQFGLWIP